MQALFWFFALILCHTVFAATMHEVYSQGDLTPLNITPTFDKGYLFVYDSQKIDVYAPDGWPVGSISAQVPDARVALIQNAAADTDGRMAGAIEYYRDKTSRTAGGGVAVFDRSGKQVRFFDTGRTALVPEAEK